MYANEEESLEDINNNSFDSSRSHSEVNDKVVKALDDYLYSLHQDSL